MKTLKDLKVGDIVWTIQDGFTNIIRIDENHITTNSKRTYYLDGKYHSDNKYPSMFIENPFEHKIKPKEMMCEWQGSSKKVECIVSDDGRVFVQSGYSNAKEIEPEDKLGSIVAVVSLKQIAEKFGLNIEDLRIKP